MYRIVLHNKEAMSSNNLIVEKDMASFKDIAGNSVFIPLTSILMIVKTKEEEQKEEEASGASS